MTKLEARKIVRWFQREIGLLDWKFTIVIGDPPPELGDSIIPAERDNFCGRSLVFTQFHRATIWINPKGHEKRAMIDSEEETLLHEMLHCFWDAIGMDDEGQQCEWANSRLAAVLFKQYQVDNK